MKKIISIILVTILMLNIVLAQEETTEYNPPDPLVLPNSFLYGAKKIVFENAEGLVYRVMNRQAEHEMLKASRRLAELEKLPDDVKDDYEEELLEEYEEDIKNAHVLGTEISDLAKEKRFFEKLELATSYHLQVLERVKLKIENRTRAENIISISKEHKKMAQTRQEAIKKAQEDLGKEE